MQKIITISTNNRNGLYDITSEVEGIIDGKAGLSTWQNIFLSKFDGPGNKREIVVTVIGDKQ